MLQELDFWRDGHAAGPKGVQRATTALNSLGFVPVGPTDEHPVAIMTPPNEAHFLHGVESMMAQARPRVPARGRHWSPKEQTSSLKQVVSRAKQHLELHFELIAGDQNFSAIHGIPGKPTKRYNPLQLIRNRAQTPHSRPRSFIWEIGATEQLADFTWRQKQVAFDSGNASVASLVSTPPRSLRKKSEDNPLMLIPSRQDSADGQPVDGSFASFTSFQDMSSRRESASKSGNALITRLKSKYTDTSSDESEPLAPPTVFSRGRRSKNSSSVSLGSPPRRLSSLSPTRKLPTQSMSMNELPALMVSEHFDADKSNPSESEDSEDAVPVLEKLEALAVKKYGDFDELEHAQQSLNYAITVFEMALHKRELTRNVPDYKPPKCCNADVTDDMVGQFLSYLTQVEQDIITRQESLEVGVVRKMDSLRVNTERMASAVSTTLNRQLRETAARLDRLDKPERCIKTKLIYYVGFTSLEYAVLFTLRIIWVIAKSVVILKYLLTMLC